MSNKSTKSVSSKRQKGIGSPNPNIKIVDTSRTTSRGTSLIAEPIEENHFLPYWQAIKTENRKDLPKDFQYTSEPLRMRIEYK